MLCGDEYGRRQIERLAPYLFNAYFQNMRIVEGGPVVWRPTNGDPVAAEYAPVGDHTAIDVREMIAALKDVGYDGWFSDPPAAPAGPERRGRHPRIPRRRRPPHLVAAQGSATSRGRAPGSITP